MKNRVKNKLNKRIGFLLKNFLPDSKLSQGHLEFIISFVLFVTAIFLLFIFLNPLGKTESKAKIQENAGILIQEEISDIIDKLNIFTKPPNCYSFNLAIYGDNFYETYTEFPPTNNRSYEIYFSPHVINYNTSYDDECPSDSYAIGVRSRENLIIKNLSLDLKKRYEENYVATKKALGISNDFSFSFRYLDGTLANELSVDRTTSSNIEKYAKEYPVRVMDDHADIVEMIITIKLW